MAHNVLFPCICMPDNASNRILLVDDDNAVLLSHSIILENQGYNVTRAATFASARELAREGSFDLLICDLSLDHGASGLDVVSEVLRRRPTAPVILMTGYSDTEISPELASARVKLISKPAVIPEFLRTVKVLLSGEDESGAWKQGAP